MRFRAALAALTVIGALYAGPAHAAAPAKTCPQWEPLLARYFPQTVVPKLSRIAWRESRCNPKSVSATRYTGYPDVGLLQIQGSWKTVTIRICRPKGSHLVALQNPTCNLRVARYLYDNGGLGHWRASSGQ